MRRASVTLCCAVLALTGLATAQASSGAPARTLYLLAATPGDLRPANLYWVAPGRRLKLARVIMGLARNNADVDHSGVYGVVDNLQGCLYVITPVMADVAHKQAKVTAVNETAPLDVFSTAYPAEIPPDGVAGGADPASLLILSSARGVYFDSANRILPRPDASGSMIEQGEEADFAAMRYAGTWVGDSIPAPIDVQAIGWALRFGAAAIGPVRGIRFAPLPPDLPPQDSEMMPPEVSEDARGNKTTVTAPVPLAIVFATARYIGVAGFPPGFKIKGGFDLVNGTQTFVYDRQEKTWQQYLAPQASGWPPPECCPEARAFGDWVAYPVVVVHRHQPALTPGPGALGERTWGSFWYPPTFSGYEFVLGDFEAMPGTVWMRNLADHRVVEIETHIRDTEVLDIEPDGTILYRCDDKIYRSRIEGEHLAPAKLVVQGDDVPEVHWAFWSPQPPPAKPIGLENAVPHGAEGGRLWP